MKIDKKTRMETLQISTKIVWMVFISAILMGIFLIGTVSADLVKFDNFKTYDETSKTVTIDNFFGLGGKIAEVKLETPQVNYVMRGKDRLVAEFTINNSEVYTQGVLDNMEFYNLNDKNKSISRTFTYKYKYLLETIDVNDYKETCSEVTDKNETKYNSCVQDLVGTHKEDVYDWKEFNPLELSSFKSGTTTIGIYTDVLENDYVEWVPTLYGVKINEWAVWAESFNSNLTGYWGFNGTLNASVGTNMNGINTTYTAGKYGNALLQAEGCTGNPVSFNAANYNWLTKSVTINFWIKENGGVHMGSAIAYAKGFFLYNEAGSKSLQAWDVTSSLIGNVAYNTVTDWVMLTVVYNQTHKSVWVNGTFAGSLTRGSITHDTISIGNDGQNGSCIANGKTDELMIWERALSPAEIATLYDSGTGTFYEPAVIPIADLNVILNSPANNTKTSASTLTFIANYTYTNLNISNGTYYIWNSDGTTFNKTTLTATATTNQTSLVINNLLEGNYNWDVYGCGYNSTDTTCNWSTQRNWTFSIDTTAPTIVINYGNGTFPYRELVYNHTINFTATDGNLQNCWVGYNSTNRSISCSSGSIATQNFTLVNNIYTAIVYANDSLGNLKEEIVTWNYRLYLTSLGYTSPIIEGISTPLSANFTTNGSSITVAVLNYNGTNYLAAITSLGSNNFTVSKTVSTPYVSAVSNVPFYWNITQGSLEKITPTKNQVVSNFGIDNCLSTSNNFTLYNFTIVDEELQSNLVVGTNISSRIEMSIYPYGSSTPIVEFNHLYNELNPFAVCISNITGSEQFQSYVLVEYSANGYEREFYYIQNQTINSSSLYQNITLYDLNTSDSQVFRLVIKDSSFLSIPNALIEIHRKYINEGLYKIVEIPKTDANGETLGHLVLNDVIYKFVIKLYGATIATFTDVRAICQTPLVDECRINFNDFASGVIVPDYESNEDFNFTLGWNKTSRILSSQFLIPSGTVSTIRLVVSKFDALGEEVCTDSITSNSGTLSCLVPSNFGNSTVSAKLYRDGVLQSWGSIKIDEKPSDIYGSVLVILALFIMLTLLGAGMSDNPIFTLVFLMIGVILLTALNIFGNNGFIGGTATILFLIVAIIIVIIKAGGRN